MTSLFSYQVVLLGCPDRRADVVIEMTGQRLTELGLSSDAVTYVSEADAMSRDRRLPTIALFFGYEDANEISHPALKSLIEDSNIIITLVSDLNRVGKEIPQSLCHINAIDLTLPDKNVDRICSLILEGFRLLRRERRLFISYKRVDSQAVASQLYDALDARGFDVFIDTRSVPPAVDFQAELWHRMSDSDVVLLIDTPLFRQGRWTTEELAKANATNIQILHLLWPGQLEDSESAFSYFHSLEAGDFVNWTDPSNAIRLQETKVEEICRRVERLRARAIAARHSYLVDSFCDAARDSGLVPSVQPDRWISLEISGKKGIAVVPIIGIPTSDGINRVFDSIQATNPGSAETWVLYDNRGVLASWLVHLDWLDKYLPARSIKMTLVGDALSKVSAK